MIMPLLMALLAIPGAALIDVGVLLEGRAGPQALGQPPAWFRRDSTSGPQG